MSKCDNPFVDKAMKIARVLNVHLKEWMISHPRRLAKVVIDTRIYMDRLHRPASRTKVSVFTACRQVVRVTVKTCSFMSESLERST